MLYLRIALSLILFHSVNLFSQILTPITDSITMRDGKKIAADIYLPNINPSTPYSTILIQTPYNRIFYRLGLPLGIGINLSSSDFAFVITDWRCFYGSSSACTATPERGKDGYDIIEWISQQLWSNGKIGTWGPSALGRIQFQTAKENPPNLVCCVPLVSSPYYNYEEYYEGGVLRTEYVEQLDNLGFEMSNFILSHQTHDFAWQFVENENNYPQYIKVPFLMIGGWYDHNTRELLHFYNSIRSNSDANVKDKHSLLVGPWCHGGFGQVQVGTAQQGELFYHDAAGLSDSLALMFFNFYLNNENNYWDTLSKVKYYQINENKWYNSNSFPPQNIINQKLYLYSSGNISTSEPLSNSDSVVIYYNPKDPSPTIGGATLRNDLLQGPYNQDEVESRNDIAVFTTPELFQPISLKGSATVRLYVTSNRKDTDFAIRLTDVHPDGKSMLLADGIKRLRFRKGFNTNDTSSITPGNIYLIEIHLPELAVTFPAGHKIRVDITSSNYPRYDCNLNNGKQMYIAGDTLIASNTIYVNNIYKSHIEFPLSSTWNEISENEKHNTSDIFVFPNPANKYVVISINSDFKQVFEGKLFDINGKTLQNFSYNCNAGINRFKIYLTDLKSGMYFLYLASTKNHVLTSKIIINY